MPDPSEALDLVRKDVELGIGQWLTALADIESAGFRILEPFDREPAPLMCAESGTVVVPWAWVGRHDADVMGYLPTGRTIEVRGVTLVRDTDDGPAFSRFVDWVGALAEMGVGIASRPITDDPRSAGIDV